MANHNAGLTQPFFDITVAQWEAMIALLWACRTVVIGKRWRSGFGSDTMGHPNPIRLRQHNHIGPWKGMLGLACTAKDHRRLVLHGYESPPTLPQPILSSSWNAVPTFKTCATALTTLVTSQYLLEQDAPEGSLNTHLLHAHAENFGQLQCTSRPWLLN